MFFGYVTVRNFRAPTSLVRKVIMLVLLIGDKFEKQNWGAMKFIRQKHPNFRSVISFNAFRSVLFQSEWLKQLCCVLSARITSPTSVRYPNVPRCSSRGTE
jgi:hypothetical protein